MSKIGHGYGSEWHLLNYLGYHRQELTRFAAQAVGCTSIEWHDFPIDKTGKEAEWKGVDFLPANHPARKSWGEFWPQTGNVQNWDAIGRLSGLETDDWVLVEAKAHEQEIESTCKAKPIGGLGKITQEFERVINAMGLSVPVENWLSPYYQYANRVSALWRLRHHGVPARLLFVYFTGEDMPGRSCPKNPSEWQASLDKMYRHLGLIEQSDLEKHIHKLFLPVMHRTAVK
jgi:hypothetical protein